MNKIRFSMLLLTIAAIASCNKTSSTGPVKDNISSDEFSAGGISDIVFGNNISEHKSKINVISLNGMKEEITMTLEDTVGTLIGSFDKSKGTPPFDAVMTISSKMMKPGTYPLQVVMRSKTGHAAGYRFNVEVRETTPTDCKLYFRDRVEGTEATISDANGTYGKTPLKYDGYSKELNFMNVYLGRKNNEDILSTAATPVFFKVDCSGRTITIHEQEIKGKPASGAEADYTISGEGKIYPEESRYEIQYRYTSDGSTWSGPLTINGPINF